MLLKNIRRWLAPVAGLFFTFLLCVSCENDMNEIRKITLKSTDPDERTRNMEMLMTDSGYAKVQILATLVETYSSPAAITKLKDGVRINFFDEDGRISSVLTAKYGEVLKDEDKMMVRDSVTLYSIKKNQKLETEQLYWTQRDSVIYTEKPVKVTTPDAILFGEGLKCDQEFTSYEFFAPKGSMNMKQ